MTKKATTDKVEQTEKEAGTTNESADVTKNTDKTELQSAKVQSNKKETAVQATSFFVGYEITEEKKAELLPTKYKTRELNEQSHLIGVEVNEPLLMVDLIELASVLDVTLGKKLNAKAKIY